MDVKTYLSSFYSGTKNPSLKAMQYFMKEFGEPQEKLKIIHIAGTNGKGSQVEMLSSILTKAGYRVGKFMSPHLVTYHERISVANQNISDSEMEQLIEKIQPQIEAYHKANSEKVTLFELETTMAILYFCEKKCDIVLLETGLGGLYDCTNIVHPMISMITSIGYDHMNLLGNTLLEIAQQKAGIIKENSETIFLEQEPEINNEIEQVCLEKNNQLHLIEKKDITNISYDENFQKFDYQNFKNMKINLKGKKQIENAVMCIKAVQVLNNESYFVSENELREGLKTVVHKGRFEKINNNPLIIYDGAHNQNAIEHFVQNVQRYYENKDKVYVVSILKTKDYEAILKELLKDEKAIFIFTSGNDENSYVAKEKLLEVAKKYTKNSQMYARNLEDALNLVQATYKKYVTFIVGSFYVYGTVMEKLKGRDKND